MTPAVDPTAPSSLAPRSLLPAPPFRFGIQVRGAESAGELVATARRAETLGFDVLTVPDHFPFGLAPFPALATVAAATERLRVGTFVAANDFRHPVVLAKEAATLDLLSGGRLELGVGAGWMRSEYEAAGFPFDRPGVRIARLAEGIAVLRLLLGAEGEGPVSFAGEHFRVTDLALQPRPVQTGGPPILVGGGGRRVLTLAAQVADIVGFSPRALADGSLDPTSTSEEATAEKAAWVDEAARGAGRVPERGLPERNLYVYGVTETDDQEASAAAMSAEGGIPAEVLLGSPHFLFGTIEEMVTELEAARTQLGISYVTVPSDLMEATAPIVERLRGR
ncbi:MAG: hypothetical protein AVDCRST_MAG59-3993 [uncultured Thermomicrobiales bacterium]|uniref:Luciferase-like domain-containing protein n=1 Tax=uncultured Thermomicrobiales bacterium TaxID=1645740 RepID=A0A6J4VCB5_9BACT|nr:MAG: hypothetical protein AVDCRST_MAG59-3993 [uncultured Thermomicrobiales bacterium]